MNLAIFLTYIVVAKPILLLVLPLWGLHLRFESIVYALSLRKRMVHIFWACNLVHSHIRTHRHTLVDLTMSSRWQRISPILSFYITSGRDVTVAPMSGAMRPIVGLISWFHHRWKLQLLIVKIVGFFASVSFSMTRNFLFEIYCS